MFTSSNRPLISVFVLDLALLAAGIGPSAVSAQDAASPEPAVPAETTVPEVVPSDDDLVAIMASLRHKTGDSAV